MSALSKVIQVIAVLIICVLPQLAICHTNGMPDSLDENLLNNNLRQINDDTSAARVKRAWLHVGIARARLLKDQAPQSEVSFAAAVSEARQAGDLQLQNAIEQLRLDLLSRDAASKGDFERMQQLVAGFQPYEMLDQPALLRLAIRYSACLLEKKFDCVAHTHNELTRFLTQARSGLWEEDFLALKALAKALSHFGLGEWAAQFQYAVASATGMASEEVVLELLTGVEYGLKDEVPHPIVNGLLDLAEQHIKGWERLDDASQDAESLNEQRGTLIKLKNLFRIHWYVLADERMVPEAYKILKTNEGWPSSVADDILNHEEWISMRALALATPLQSLLTAAYEDHNNGPNIAALMRRVYLLAFGAPVSEMGNIASIYAQAFVKLQRAEPDTGLRRRTVKMLLMAGLEDEAIIEGIPLVEELLLFAEAGGPVSDALQHDLYLLTYIGGHSQSQSSLQELQRVLDRASKLSELSNFTRTLGLVANSFSARSEPVAFNAAVAAVIKEPSLTPLHKSRLLWILVQRLAIDESNFAMLEPLLRQIENFVTEASDEQALNGVRLVRIMLLLNRAPNEATRMYQQLRAHGHSGRTIYELVATAVVGHRIVRAGGSMDSSADPLCGVRELYRHAGYPEIGWLKFAPDEEAMLINKSVSAPNNLCLKDENQTLQAKYLTSLSEQTNQWMGNLVVSADHKRMVLRIASLPEGSARREVADSFIQSLANLDSPSARKNSYLGVIAEFDRLQIPFAPEVLHMSALIERDQYIDKKIRFAAAERLAIGRALSNFSHADTSHATQSVLALLPMLNVASRYKLVVDDTTYKFEQIKDDSPAPSKDQTEQRLPSPWALDSIVRSAASEKMGLACNSADLQTLEDVLAYYQRQAEIQWPAQNIYRVAQALLYCGRSSEAVAWYQKALMAVQNSKRPSDALIFQAYWAADNTSLGKAEAAINAAAEVVRTHESLSDSSSTRYGLNVRYALFSLVNAGFYQPALELSRSAIARSCTGEDRRSRHCRYLALISVFAFAGGKNPQETLQRLQAVAQNNDPVLLLEMAKVAIYASEISQKNLDFEKSEVLLSNAKAALQRISSDDERYQRLGLQIQVAHGLSCVGDWQKSIEIIKLLIAENKTSSRSYGLTWHSEKHTRNASRSEERLLGLAVDIADIEQRASKDPRVSSLWDEEKLPRLTHLTHGLQNIPVSERANALFVAGYSGEALLLLRNEISRFREEIGDLAGNVFQQSIVTYLATQDGGTVAMNRSLLETLDTGTAPDAVGYLSPLIKRLLADAAYRQAEHATALSHLLTASVSEGQWQSRPSQGRLVGADAAESQVLSDSVENLAYVVRQRALKNSKSRSPIEELQDAHQRIKRKQRPLLALLVANHGSSSLGSIERQQELAFKILQAAAVGPTGLDLLTALQRAEIEDPELRNAMRVVSQAEEQRQEQEDKHSEQNKFVGTFVRPTCPVPQDEAMRSPDLLQGGVDKLSNARGLNRSFPRIPEWRSAFDSVPMEKEELVARAKVDKGLQRIQSTIATTAPLGLKPVLERLQSHQAIVFAVTEEDATYVALITSKGLRVHEAKIDQRPLTATALETLVNELRGRLSLDAVVTPPEKGDILFHALFGSFSRQLQDITDMSIVARGPLESLPFSILATGGHSTEHGGLEWFDDRYVWQFALAPINDKGASSQHLARSRKVVQIGPPPFKGGDQCAAPIREIDGASTDLSDRMCNIDGLTGLHQSLPNTPDIKIDRSIYASSNATKQQIMQLTQRLQLKELDLLIVATHGLLPSETAILTGIEEPAIVLAPTPSKVKQDAILLSSEIAKLDLNAREVVLVACNSAGPAARSDEQAFSGLVRSFIRGGAQRVVAAMVAVPTDTTEILMSKYFSQRARDVPVAQALHQARMLMRKRNFSEPVHWGGMVAIGSY